MPLTVLRTMRSGLREWNGPRSGAPTSRNLWASATLLFLLPEIMIFSALTMIICSPFSSLLAILLHSLPRISPSALTMADEVFAVCIMFT